MKEPQFKNAVAFQVNYDSQTKLVRKLGIRYRSTIVVFKGTKELLRSVGDTNEERIREMFIKGL